MLAAAVADTSVEGASDASGAARKQVMFSMKHAVLIDDSGQFCK
jgi:hypothetical protein